jgi:hypothetical protein
MPTFSKITTTSFGPHAKHLVFINQTCPLNMVPRGLNRKFHSSSAAALPSCDLRAEFAVVNLIICGEAVRCIRTAGPACFNSPRRHQSN